MIVFTSAESDFCAEQRAPPSFLRPSLDFSCSYRFAPPTMATGIVLVPEGNVTRPLFCTNTAPTADLILTVDDAADILGELLPAQNQSFLLGLRLKLQFYEVETIQKEYKDPKDRLLQTIIAFLKRAEPKPTWRVIVDALKNPTLGLPALVKKLEAVHFPTTDTTRAQDETTGMSPSAPLIFDCMV